VSDQQWQKQCNAIANHFTLKDFELGTLKTYGMDQVAAVLGVMDLEDLPDEELAHLCAALMLRLVRIVQSIPIETFEESVQTMLKGVRGVTK
jgi:hypothetical protein